MNKTRNVLNSLPNDKILDLSKFKAFADSQISLTQKLKFVLGRVENIAGERRKFWLPAFSPLPIIFSKAFFSRCVKRQDCVVKSCRIDSLRYILGVVSGNKMHEAGTKMILFPRNKDEVDEKLVKNLLKTS